ncbi:MAG TPA: type-4 fimbrial pilin related signal peptide protein [Janthinobacterium sp.]|nr:type-4 fimbrial pilin related signal peptide protein [Janthinobacterium sp.]
MRRGRRGFSLTELMVVMAIAAIVLAAAIPNLSGLIARQRLRVATNDLFAALDLTRAQAIARGERVLLMPSEPGGDWSRGWVVFVDRNASVSLDPGDELIFRQGPVGAGISIKAVFSSKQLPSYLAYNGAGRSCSVSNSMAARFGTISVAMGGSVRNIKINMLGRARVCDPEVEPDSCGAAD